MFGMLHIKVYNIIDGPEWRRLQKAFTKIVILIVVCRFKEKCYQESSGHLFHIEVVSLYPNLKNLSKIKKNKLIITANERSKFFP